MIDLAFTIIGTVAALGALYFSYSNYRRKKSYPDLEITEVKQQADKTLPYPDATRFSVDISNNGAGKAKNLEVTLDLIEKDAMRPPSIAHEDERIRTREHIQEILPGKKKTISSSGPGPNIAGVFLKVKEDGQMTIQNYYDSDDIRQATETTDQ